MLKRIRLTQGSILKHLRAMTLPGSLSLLALFSVELADLFFVSRLGDIALPAGLGYAGSVLFFSLSLCLGLSIGASAAVAQLLGAEAPAAARRQSSHNFLLALAALLPLTALMWLSRDFWLELVGADGAAAAAASDYLAIVLLSTPLLGIGMVSGGTMRAAGDARGPMRLTLASALLNALLDPLFIFTFDWGLAGAAWATLVARLAMAVGGVYLVRRRVQLLARPQPRHLREDALRLGKVALPAALTRLSNPLVVAVIMANMANFGDAAVAGAAAVLRLQQVAFAGIYALPAALGPVVGQNFGAGAYLRVRRALSRALGLVGLYCLIVCTLLWPLAPLVVQLFAAEGVTADIIRWFCRGICWVFLSNGALFVATSVFTNIDRAAYATELNFGRALLGTLPFVWLGAQWAGPLGIYMGYFFGNTVVALLAVGLAYRKVSKLARAPEAAAANA